MDRSIRFFLLFVLGVFIPMAFMMVPLYLRHKVYVNTHTAVASSDYHLLNHRVSTVWCEAETIVMNTTFNAYLMNGWPNFENSTRTYWTTKHFALRAEDKEYWGFYLPKGSVLTVAACARYDGAHLSVVKGRRNLKKCSKSAGNDSGETENEEEEEEEEDESGEDEEESDDDEESSFSSSEEDFDHLCQHSVINKTLTPSRFCEDRTWYPNYKVSYTVPSTDYYYLILTSTNIVFPNKIYSKFTLHKPVYNVKEAVQGCKNVTRCRLPFGFAADQHVVLEVPDREPWTADVALAICEPRTVLYFPFYLGVPLSILFFAFHGNGMKR